MSRCASCYKITSNVQRHHKFHNVGWARKLYKDLMDDPKNIQIVCADCNVSHAGVGLIHWNENIFCAALGINPRSKGSKLWA